MPAKKAAPKKPEAVGLVPRRLEYMPVSTLKTARRNPKLHLEDDIETSVHRFGYVEPIVLDERTQRLVAGHGRLTVLRRLLEDGEPPPEGVKAKGKEWFIPVLRGWRSQNDKEAEAYLVASNQLTIGGGWDGKQLTAMLEGLKEDDALEGLGFSKGELERLLGGVSRGTGIDLGTEVEPEPVKLVECPHCHKQFAK